MQIAGLCGKVRHYYHRCNSLGLGVALTPFRLEHPMAVTPDHPRPSTQAPHTHADRVCRLAYRVCGTVV